MTNLKTKQKAPQGLLNSMEKQDFKLVLGNFPENKKDADKIAAGIEGLYKERLGHAIFQALWRFMVISIRQRVIRDYHAGTISPGLGKLLRMDLPKPEGERPAAGEQEGIYKNWQGLISEMIQAGKADFSPYKGPQDTGENWLFRYTITPYILSYFVPDSITVTENTLKEIKAEAALQLKGILAAALDDTQPGQHRLDPIKEETVSHYVEALNYLYSIRTGAEAELHFPIAAETVGLYMNPETGKVIDLRPYAEEIKNLTAPISWKYITDYTEIITGYLAERKRKAGQLLGPGDFVAIKSTPESTAISTLTAGYSEIFAQGSLFPDETKDYTTEIITSQTDRSRRLQIRMNAPKGSRGPRPSTMKLKILLEMLFTDCRKPFFTFSIEQYMKATLRPGQEASAAMKKKFKKKLLSDLRILKGTTLKANYPGQEAGEIGLLNDWVPGPGNTMEIGMDLVYCSHLKRGGLAYYPRGIFQIDEKFPHAIHFLEKLAQNRTGAKNVRKGGKRKNTIAIRSLIETDYGFLPLEKVQKTRKYKEAYIDPTINTITYLNEAGYISSRYVNGKHEEYTADDLSRVKYEDFIDRKKWLLEYDLIDYQDSPSLTEPRPQNQKPKRAPRKKKAKQEEP